MSDSFKYTKNMIEWRRNMVVSYLAKGWSQQDIAKVLKRVSEISDSAVENKTKMECLKLQMELYRSLVSMATDGGIIEKAMKMVKIISPLPGEEIPAESQEDKEQKEDDISKEETDGDITTEEDPPKEE